MADPRNLNSQMVLEKIKNLLGPNGVCVGHETLAISSTAVSLASIPTNATYALLQVESSVTSGTVVRYWEDGSNPTSTVGIFRSHGDPFDIINPQNLQQFRIIQTQGGTHQVNVLYYK